MYHRMLCLGSSRCRRIVPIRRWIWTVRRHSRVIEWMTVIFVDRCCDQHCRTWGDPWRVTDYWPWWYLSSLSVKLNNQIKSETQHANSKSFNCAPKFTCSTLIDTGSDSLLPWTYSTYSSRIDGLEMQRIYKKEWMKENKFVFYSINCPIIEYLTAFDRRSRVGRIWHKNVKRFSPLLV